jgi:predicted kinase
LGVVNTTPVLYLFSGLPGTGKTTLAQNLARKEKAAYLRIDTVEQALRDSCGLDVQDEGYGLSYRIARDNLRLGVSVVADACNALESVRAGVGAGGARQRQPGHECGSHLFRQARTPAASRNPPRDRCGTQAADMAGSRKARISRLDESAHRH